MLAIGECALWDNKIYGLVAPGYQMARIAAATLAGEDACFSGADMSTKLKLLGSTWPRLAMRRAHAGLSELSMDRRSAADLQKNRRQSGRQSPAWRRAGGDASDYATLLQMMLNGMALPPRPESLILPALEGAAPKALGVAALPDSAPICSCHNVSKGDICRAVNNGAGICRR
nr:nitrite reductase subunit NirD [Klebsiella pneumoniae]